MKLIRFLPMLVLLGLPTESLANDAFPNEIYSDSDKDKAIKKQMEAYMGLC